MTTSRRFLELVEEINDKGWLVSGLHQIDAEHWMASVRKNGNFISGYGQSEDPITALENAWDSRKRPERDRAAPQGEILKPDKAPRERIEEKRSVKRIRI